MLKKMMLLAAAVAALVAFAAPAAAQAEALITDSNGGAATSVTALSTDTVTKAGGGTLECTTVHLNIGLTVNNTETATGSGSGSAEGDKGLATHSGDCTLSGLKTTVESVSVNHIHLLDDGTGTANFTFTFTVKHPVIGNFMCKSDGEANLTYETGSDEISVSATLTGTENIPPCAAGGELNGTFKLTDESGEPAEIM